MDKAFDSVQRENNWKISERREVDKNLMQAVQSMNETTVNIVSLGKKIRNTPSK